MKKRFDLLQQIGCIACRINGVIENKQIESRCEIHHLREGQGMALRAIDIHTIGLCPIHHRYGDMTYKTGYQPSFHLNKKKFVQKFGSELYLLELTNLLLTELT
jgi:hypothetical protein